MADTLLVSIPTSEALAQNWGTMVEDMERRLHREGAVDTEAIKAALIRAMRHFRWERFTFNEATHLMWAQEGIYKYEMGTDTANGFQLDADLSGETEPTLPDTSTVPRDIIKIDEIKLRGEDETWWSPPLESSTLAEIRNLRRSDSHQSTPRLYTWHQDSIFLFPLPNRNFLMKMDYVRDVGVPIFSYDSTNGWQFFEPWTGTPLADTWTSPWFEHADELIGYRAMWDIYEHYLDDTDNANRMMFSTDVALRNLRKARTGRNSGRRLALRV